MAGGECPTYPDTPCRVNLDLMPEGTDLWMYLLTAAGLLVFGYGIWQMVQVWRMGQPWQKGPWQEGAKRLVRAVMTHHKFRHDPRPGAMHFWIFLGFLVLFIGTTIVAIDADIFELLLDSKLLRGSWYLVFEVVLDLFGVLFLVGVAWAFVRRYGERPPQLHKTEPVERPPALRTRIGGDGYALVFLFLIGVTGFLMEAMRLEHQIQQDGITYASYSFVGYALGQLIFNDWQIGTIQTGYQILWWTHFVLWTSVLAVLPWTKFKHIVTSSLNIYYHDPKRQSLPELGKPFDLGTVMADPSAEMPQVGVATIRDFTWKDRLSFDACTNCGRCESECPAWAAGRPLSPRKLIQDLKRQMWDDHYAARKDPEHKPPLLRQTDQLGAAIEEATLWSCTTCRACVTACPVDIEHVDHIMGMRRALVMESRLDEHQTKLIVNITNAGNPYGFPAADRADWTNGLHPGIRVPTAAERAAQAQSPDTTAGGTGTNGTNGTTLADGTSGGPPFEYLWWIGCSGSYDPRNQEVTRAVATILNAAAVDFAILGTEERCNGDPARRLGEEGRFQQSVMENMAVLEQYGVRKVITQCPHCFNTLRNEYPQFGAKLEVVHHTQFIEQLIDAGRLPLKEDAPIKVTYHDSCYLGRHNDIFEAPRRVLQKANGLPVLEMAQNRDTGMCCGAGGANMWYEIKDERERINVIRAKMAADTGADTVATACPFCLTMMNDGISLSGNDDRMVAQDLAEIVVRHLDWEPPHVEQPTESPAAAAGGGDEWLG